MKIRNLVRWISKRKESIIVFALWSILIVLVTIRIWLTCPEYIPDSYSDMLQMGFYIPLEDLLILVLISLVVGALRDDPKEFLLGYSASILSAFTISVASIYLYAQHEFVWARELVSSEVFGWERRLFASAGNVLKIIFPWIVGVCFLGMLVGAFVRTWIAWHFLK